VELFELHSLSQCCTLTLTWIFDELLKELKNCNLRGDHKLKSLCSHDLIMQKEVFVKTVTEAYSSEIKQTNLVIVLSNGMRLHFYLAPERATFLNQHGVEVRALEPSDLKIVLVESSPIEPTIETYRGTHWRPLLAEPIHMNSHFPFQKDYNLQNVDIQLY